ncbi:MAG TPA: hypothetical protein VK864_15565 [Longimicrobiales bacterium]|nr:hypothetical protein [Longimicrobiales bacterium]
MSDDGEPVEDDQHPHDLKGCFFFAFRATGCILWLYITMFFAIICAAILSLLFYR